MRVGLIILAAFVTVSSCSSLANKDAKRNLIVDAVKKCSEITACKAAVGLGAAGLIGDAAAKKASMWLLEKVWGKRDLVDSASIVLANKDDKRNLIADAVKKCSEITACKAAVGLGAAGLIGDAAAKKASMWLLEKVWGKRDLVDSASIILANKDAKRNLIVDAVKKCSEITACKAAVGLGAAGLIGDAAAKKASMWLLEKVWGKRDLIPTAAPPSIVELCAEIAACKAAVGLGSTAVEGKLLTDAAWQWMNEDVINKIG